MKRKGFTLVLAIIVLIIVSSLAAFMVSLSSSSAKETSDIYLKEQAELLMQSATEYAILAILGHDNYNNCLENINITYPSSSNPIFDINVSLWYIFDSPVSSTYCSHVVSSDLVNDDSNFTVIIDTTITTTANTGLSEPVRLHRRTIQKP
ncbi:MAG: type II secretion system protein [Epsilonproteobacteria bacterium]|nr:type II secretion system protein [Campylobacterota bacterium]